MEKLFKIQNLQNTTKSFLFLSELQNQVLNCAETDIILDFSSCQFSHAVFTSFLGVMTEIGDAYSKKMIYRFEKGSKTFEYFYRSGLYDYLMSESEATHANQNALSFWKVELEDEEKLMKLSDNARQQLFKNFYELFTNAKDHSEQKYGVFVCGHWLPKVEELVFSLYDTGIGIPRLVQNKVNSHMNGENALQWALQTGHSTRQLEKGVPRGLGLSDLQEFVDINNGRLTILSNDVYYDYNKRNEFIKEIPYEIIGTLICVTICKDDGLYVYEESE